MPHESEFDLVPLSNAVARLGEAVAAAQAFPQEDLFRDAAIKRFEFTYELSRKTLLRYMTRRSNSLPSNENPSLPTLIRSANQDGLLKGTWEDWSTYRDMRNRTSHTYDQNQAEKVFAIVPAFLGEVQFLVQQLTERLNDATVS